MVFSDKGAVNLEFYHEYYLSVIAQTFYRFASVKYFQDLIVYESGENIGHFS